MFKFIATTNPADIIDPSATLGIEVTIPVVVAQCGLGNIDPQHGWGSRLFKEFWSTAAISTAITVDDAILPRDGTLVTTRPDLDSIGAMAVIVLRAIGMWFDATGKAPIGAFERAMTIAKADAFAPSAEWTPSPLPTTENPWPRAGSVDSTKELAHLGMICSPRRGDMALPLAERVAVIACWLLMGIDELPMNRTDENGPIVSSIYRACGVEPWREPEEYPLDRILNARALVLESRRGLAAETQKASAIARICGSCRQQTIAFRDEMCRGCGAATGHVAIVRVAHAGAMGLGYCVAPVVVAFDQANPGKVTIAAYSAKYLDVAALKARLNELEATWLQRRETLTCEEGAEYSDAARAASAAFDAGNKWGGGVTIVGSPQSAGTSIADPEAIIAVLRGCLR